MDGTILLMDYSSYERQKMRQIIDKIGSFNIVDVGSIGQFKLLNLKISDLKLIILNLAFPTENDSFDALARIRFSENLDVPVIVIAQSDKHELLEEVLKYSVNDYIIKPYQVKRLESSIRSLIRVTINFHYNTGMINEIKMSFEEFTAREIEYSKRAKSPLSLILMTTLQIGSVLAAGQKSGAGNKASILEMAVKKAKEALRSTDTVVLNQDRDIIIVLPCTDENGARLVCEKIKALMAPEFEKMKVDQNEYIYPVYVTFPNDGENFQTLMETAFKKVSNKDMLEKIVSISATTIKYADKSYNRYRKWF